MENWVLVFENVRAFKEKQILRVYSVLVLECTVWRCKAHELRAISFLAAFKLVSLATFRRQPFSFLFVIRGHEHAVYCWQYSKTCLKRTPTGTENLSALWWFC